MVRKGLVLLWMVVLFSGISYLFWHNEWKYSLPTPIPENYKAVAVGDAIAVSEIIKTDKNKPSFIHFFNPDCPCSRFNIPHFKSLVKQYGDKITFTIAVINKNAENYTEKEIQDKFNLKLHVVFDGSLATTCGVYSTPQAVILSTNNKLYYRGNYNKTRYCTDKKSNYAQMALDSLINDRGKPVFSIAALKSYGCELPDCCTK